MKKFLASKTVLVYLLLLVFVTTTTNAQHLGYTKDIDQFAKQDSLNPPPKNLILFIGSSSFTYWKTMQQDLPEYTLLNRAFGGSTLYDLLYFAPQIILKYQPRQVVIYCGENDLGTSSANTSDTVVNRFKRLFHIIRSNHPKAKISYVSMKPSPSREHLMPAFDKANNEIRKFLKKKKNTSYIDTYKHMLLPDGKPMPDIFVDDRLHMNRKGYEIWIKIIKPHLLRNPK